MYLIGHVIVTIANSVLETVNSIVINNDAAQLGSNCEITVPINSRIENKGQYLIAPTRTLFKSGDRVQIDAYYEGYPVRTIFKGFVYDYIEGTPLKIRCLDYVYLLRQTTINKSWADAKIKDVINYILTNTGITLMEPYVDFEVQGLNFPNMSPAACLEWIKKELGLTITIISDKLYFNVARNTLKEVKLKSDVNVIGAKLQKPDGAFQKLKVNINMLNSNGTKKIEEVGDNNGEVRSYNFYCVKDKYHTKLKDNALEQVKLGHYTGEVETLLYPEIDLFYSVNYESVRYPDQNGIYSVRGCNYLLNHDGFHQKLTLAYLSERFENINTINTVNQNVA
jgi:hypothetical protein